MAGHAGQTPYKKPVLDAKGNPTANLQWVWPDGTPLDMNEQLAAESIQNGSITSDEQLASLFPDGVPDDFKGAMQPNGLAHRMGQATDDYLSNPNGASAADPGLPSVVTPQSPGASLDTAQADEDKKGTEKLLSDLQQQAATGGGAWESALKNATEKASAGASALGQEQQNQTGGDYANALRNIGNAQAGAQQRAAGQGEILREKSKQSAMQGLTSLTGSMQGNAASQAATQAAIKRQIADTNSALIGESQKADEGRGNAMLAGISASDGGKIPGEPEVFGDDERNDTVHAKLSPGEIVIPRSIAEGPNAPEHAAAFVRAIQAREDGGHAGNFADGGETGGDQAFGPYASGQAPNGDATGLHGTTAEDFGSGNYIGHWVMPHAFDPAGYQRLREKYVQSGAPSIENGGLLNTDAYNTARGAAMQNNAAMLQSTEGHGPSTAPQMMQNTADSNIEAALQAQAAGKSGPGLVGQATAAQQQAAGQAAGLAAEEQQAGQAGASKAFSEQQARDLAFAKAQQEAAWSNTMINAGLGLDQQAAMRNIFAGAGQAATALSGLEKGGGNQDPYKGFGETSDPYSFDTTSSTGSEGDFGSPTEDTSGFSTDMSGNSGEASAWEGGEITEHGVRKKKRGHAAAFAAACGGRA